MPVVREPRAASASTLHPIVTGSHAPEAGPPIVVAPRPEQPRLVPAAVVTFVERVKQLPLFSSTAMQLMKSVGQIDVSTQELARLISTDAGLVAQLLRIVNSPFYGLPKRCGTVADAIAVLGMDQVRRTVSAAVTKRPIASYLRDSRVVNDFWRHQLLCAALARHLAVQRGLDGEVAHMAGLMHEVGRLAILIQHPHLINVLLDVERRDDVLGTAREVQHFGFDHAQVGGTLLARWGLPAPIVQAAYDHEETTQPADAMSAVVWRANLLAHDLCEKSDELEVETPWMTAIGLTLDGRRAILDEIAALESAGG